eukprot:Awhi_evm1s2939
MKINSFIFPTALVALMYGKNVMSKECQGKPEYELKFKYNWKESTTPRGFPDNPHFSEFVVCTHNGDYHMWRPGEKASQGVINIAEEGDLDTISDELDDAGKSVYDTALTDFQPVGVGTQRVRIKADENRTLLSAISMIAPSPDWFFGIRDVQLCDEKTGKWIPRPLNKFKLFAYDAGSDSGPLFTSDNDPTDPVTEIFRLDSDAPNDPDSAFFGRKARPFGYVTVTQKK